MANNIHWDKLRYFKKHEFRKNPDKAHPNTVLLCDDIRHTMTNLSPTPADVRMVIHVAWDDNGHAPNSYHYKDKALAVDFHIAGVPLPMQYAILTSFRRIGALGFYPWWHSPGWHLDLRPNDRRIEWLCEKVPVNYVDEDLGIECKEFEIRYNYDCGAILKYMLNYQRR
jgi:hypothetical protein